MRLHVGCGKHVLDGWVNCDVEPSPKAPRPPELLCHMGKIPLPDASVDELMGIHVFEHLYLWEADEVLIEWHRVMKAKALLVLEMPDLFKFIENIISTKRANKGPDQMGMWGLYGDPTTKNPYLIHKWGWTFRTLAPFLEAHGFDSCAESVPQWHKAGRYERDFRITARRV